MKILIMGPPGAGKGSQSERVVKDFDLTNISTGEMFREAFRQKTPLGLEAMRFIQEGNLVSDELTNAMVKERLSRSDAERCFLLDGYPRTVNQAKALDDMLAQMNSKLTAVIKIIVPHSRIIDRMSGRRVCEKCGATYHLKFKPPKKEHVCDACGGALYQRTDDQEDSVMNRLRIYETKTRPLTHYYLQRGILHKVNGDQSFDDVYRDLHTILKGVK